MAEFTLPTAEQMDRLNEVLKQGNEVKPPDDPWGSPGPQHIAKGNKQAGFYGFVEPHEFGEISGIEVADKSFNGINLALAVGLTGASAVSSNVRWMKFSWYGKVIFIPQKELILNINWDTLYLSGAIYGTGNELSIKEADMLESDLKYVDKERIDQDASVLTVGMEYKVRLMNDEAGEYDRLILPLHEDAPEGFYVPVEDWGINLTTRNLQTQIASNSWTQEQVANEPGSRVLRGGQAIDRTGKRESDISYQPNISWRPVLELS